MRTSKKLLAFLLSAVMVLSLVVSVSVVASAEETVPSFRNVTEIGLDTAEEIAAQIGAAITSVTAELDNSEEGILSGKWTYTEPAEGKNFSERFAVMASKAITFKTGKKYVMKFKAKADVAASTYLLKAMIDFSSNKLNNKDSFKSITVDNTKLTDEWKDYYIGFSVDSFAKGESS